MTRNLLQNVIDEWVSSLPVLRYNFNTAYCALYDYVCNSGMKPSELIPINLAYRKKNGRFKTIDELKNVKGIGEVKFTKFKKYLFIK